MGTKYSSTSKQPITSTPQPEEVFKFPPQPKKDLTGNNYIPKSIDHNKFDSNLLKLAKARNLLSTALKDANPENLEILLALPQE